MQDKILRCLGYATQYNPLAMSPGALLKADNAMIRRENVIEDRRGYKVYATLSSNVTQLMNYQSRVIALQGTTLSYDNGSGTFSNYSGTYTAPTSYKMKGVEAFSNLYVTTTLGVKVFSNITGTTGRLAGAPRALDPSYSTTGASGFLANSYQCAYRCVIRRTDTQNNTVTGYPSQRLWVTNTTGGTRNISLTTYLPSECVAGDVLQFYRTVQVSGTSTDTSGDEMSLVYQYELVSGDISAGYVTFTDSVTDALLGASLYTSPSQEGIAQANDRPPLCKDIALYKSNFMLYANTTTKQRLFVTMVGTSGLTGKTITLGGVTYNFGASEIISGGGSPQALVSATGVAAFDIDSTARSLCRVINRYASNTTIYAYYLSGPDDLPGQMMFEEKGVGASAFTVQASDTTISGMFYPAPPVGSTTTKSTSTNDQRKNGLFYSKSQQGEHVPLTNYLLVGPANTEILRVIALRDSAIIIKEEGVYRLTGENPQSFSVVPLDLTVYCRAPESVVALANQVFMLSNQGVVAISDSGVQVVSHDIEPEIQPLLTVSAISSYTAAFAYESERSYFLSTITDTSDTTANQTLVYNIFTKTWVRHTYAFTAGLVDKSVDVMFFAKPSSAIVNKERKDFADTDFADPESSITITSILNSDVTFTISGATPDVGWVILQGSTGIPIAELMVNGGGSYTGTLQDTPPASWTTGAATIYPPVGFDIEWQSWTAQNPDMLKQCNAVGFLTDDIPGNNTVSSLVATFRTNYDADTEEVTIEQPGSGWSGLWGSSPWGGAGDPAGYPTWVPRNKQYCTRMNVGVKHKNAREKISITGVAFSFSMASDRIGR